MTDFDDTDEPELDGDELEDDDELELDDDLEPDDDE
jgi:hypothetical protein